MLCLELCGGTKYVVMCKSVWKIFESCMLMVIDLCPCWLKVEMGVCLIVLCTSRATPVF